MDIQIGTKFKKRYYGTRHDGSKFSAWGLCKVTSISNGQACYIGLEKITDPIAKVVHGHGGCLMLQHVQFMIANNHIAFN